MAKKIVIHPVTRLEGHAKITILLDDAGDVSDVKLQQLDLRGFERFCIGKPVEELPRITTSICGVCPWAHHMASAKATDAVFGVDIPPAAKKIREFVYNVYYVEDKILNFYFLAGPDFVMGPDADPAVRNVIGIANKFPDIAKKVVHTRYMVQMMTQLISGKAIHPVAAVPGGWSKPITTDERDKLLPMMDEALEFAKFTMNFAKNEIFPKYLDTVKSLGVIKTGFLGTVDNDGALNFYDGKLRMMDADGNYEDFNYDQYTDYIAEHIEPWTYMKFPYMKKVGKFSMELDNPVGIYRVNTLARINVCDKIKTPLAQKELQEFREKFGRPAQLTLLYHWARLIELIYAAEHARELLDDPDITSTDIRIPVRPRAARGIGCVEAPRGTLIHDYETDKEGLVTNVNLIVGTTHNNAGINMAVKKAAMDLIKGGKYDQALINTIEMAYRAYDPCLSCATHTLNGALPVEINIIDNQGNIIDTLQNF